MMFVVVKTDANAEPERHEIAAAEEARSFVPSLVINGGGYVYAFMEDADPEQDDPIWLHEEPTEEELAAYRESVEQQEEEQPAE